MATGLALTTTTALLWRGSVQRSANQSLRATASNVTATLGTLLRRDTDFVSTLRTILTMQPHLSATMFNRWYALLQGSQRQVGGIGSAIVASVPAAELEAFEARRDSDPEFRSLLGRWLRPLPKPAPHPNSHRERYCFLAGGGAIIPITSLTSFLMQQDFCDPHTVVGSSQLPALNRATDTRGFEALPVDVSWLHTLFLEAAFYRPGMPLDTVPERRAAVSGWLLTSFDMRSVVALAIGHNRNLAVDLYHVDSGEGPLLAASAGDAPEHDPLTLRYPMSVDGSWIAVVRGTPLANGASANAQGILVFAGGMLVSLLLSLLVLTLARGREHALAMVAQKTRELRHQALHDALTGLPNRVLALDRAEQMLARARRGHMPVAALYIDIDAFKHINDTFGHPAGDAFLQIVAERLRTVVRESDTAARLAGDEFLVLLEGSTLDAGPQLVAERLLGVLREPYDLTEQIGRKLSVTASVGVAYGQRETAEQLIADADVALYAAKAGGKNRFAVFESEMQTAAQHRTQLELDLAEALDGDQLFLVYQPIFNLRTEQPTGVEALLRWEHPTRGLVRPDVFIPIAEANGTIVAIGRWVLQTACRQAAQWRANGNLLTISVNVSARQLDCDELVDDVLGALQSSGLDAEALTIEITETALMRDPDGNARRLAALKALGVRVAIDDFGTGYSSLAYLRQFPVDALKIDRTFIKSIADSPESGALIHTLVQLGKTLGLETFGEGIEDRSQLRHLQREQCDSGQGFLLARPLDVAALHEFLEGDMPRAAAAG